MVGVPKTVDNDLLAPRNSLLALTPRSTSPLTRSDVHTTAESHHRVMSSKSWAAARAGSRSIPASPAARTHPIPEIPFTFETSCY